MSALLCLALVVYHEARNQPEPGQFAVAEVTMRRVEDGRWPNTVCGVVYEPWQYEWTHMNLEVHEKDSWVKSKQIAEIVMSKTTTATTCADHFSRYDSNPWWSKDMKVDVQIGDHVFYCSKP